MVSNSIAYYESLITIGSAHLFKYLLILMFTVNDILHGFYYF